jgi:ribosome biogenesis GTP-binding protein YsxC/EngB
LYYGSDRASRAGPRCPITPTSDFIWGATSADNLPPEKLSEVAFVGRSNAGKSSAINAITHRKGLAKTSKRPGATRLINFFELEPGRRLVDLPGYGYAAVAGEMRRHWGVLIDAYFGSRQSLRGVIVVMDPRHPLKEHDVAMLELASAQSCRSMCCSRRPTSWVAARPRARLRWCVARSDRGRPSRRFRRCPGRGSRRRAECLPVGCQAHRRGPKETPVGPAEPAGKTKPGVG